MPVEQVDLRIGRQRGGHRLLHLHPPDGIGGELDERPIALLARAEGRLGLPAHPIQREDPFDPGDQLARGERLGQVVVGAGLQRLQPGFLARAGAQQDHRHRAHPWIRAQRCEQGHPVAPGQQGVREHQVGVSRRIASSACGPSPTELDAPPLAEQPAT